MTAVVPTCGICGENKVKLRRFTSKKKFPVWVCTTIPPKDRLPCDGYAYKISLYSQS